MAEGYGNVVGHWQALVRAWVSSETADTATIICECYFNPRGWGFQVNGLGSAAVNGQSGSTNYTTFSRPRGSWTEQWVANKTLTINKTGSGQNITCGAYVRVTGGYENGESWAGCTVYVAPRQYNGHGNPTFNVSPVAVGVDEKSHLSWGRAANQGNARFDHFEIWENHKKIYSGGGTSMDVIPANATPLPDNPDNVFYEVVEVHEWYGQYPQTITSKWVAVTRLAKPGMPRLLAPQNGQTVQSDTSTTLGWVHNARDKTAQTSAIIEYTPNYNADASSQTTQTITVTGTSQRTEVTTPAFASDATKATVSRWRVKTKGKHPDYSEWSDYNTFYSCPAPTVTIDSPAEIKKFPYTINWTFADWGSNTQIRYTVEVGVGVNSATIEQVGSDTSYTLTGTEREYKNNEEIPIIVTVYSTSGMVKSAAKMVTIAYTPPARPQLAVTTNENNLSANITALAGIDPNLTPTSSMDIYRNDKLLAADVINAQTVVDSLIPLDTLIEYRVIAKTLLSTVATSTKQVFIPSKGRIAISFGENFETTLLLGLDGKPNLKIDKEKETFESAGYTAPVAVYGTHRQASGSFDGIVYSDVDNFGTFEDVLKLMEWGKNCILRLPFTGYIYHVDVDVHITEYGSDYAQVSIDWKEIANGTKQ